MISLLTRIKDLSRAGMGIIEIVVVAGIVSLVFAGVFELVVLSTRPIAASVRQTEATFLTEEAIEAVRSLRNDSWTDNIASLTNGTTYYPSQLSATWTLSTTNPGLINGLFTRTVVLSAVYRDANDDISSTGTLDPKTKKVTATTSWVEHSETKTVTIETYITDFLTN